MQCIKPENSTPPPNPPMDNSTSLSIRLSDSIRSVCNGHLLARRLLLGF
jgi:hypothetical protein